MRIGACGSGFVLYVQDRVHLAGLSVQFLLLSVAWLLPIGCIKWA